MKKLILSVGLVLFSLQGFSQSGGLGGATTPTDTSNNPSGVGFGGALGGATSPSPAATSTPQTDTTFGIPRSTDPAAQQREEERFNFAGGSLGGQTATPNQVTPPGATPAQPSLSTPPTEPTNIPRSNVPAATGVGTGAPTSF